MTETIEVLPQSKWKRVLAGTHGIQLALLIGGVCIHAIFLYVVSTILPSIVKDIGGLAYYAWATSLFMVGSICASTSAPLFISRFGVQRAYRFALAFFMLGSIFCALAPSMSVLIFGRSLQGLGGGLLVALAYATVRLIFPSDLCPIAVSLIAGAWGIASLLGPLIGGFFAEAGIWRAAFWTAIPLCVIFGISTEYFLIGKHTPSEVSKIPFIRLLILTAAILTFSQASVPGTFRAFLIGVALTLFLLWILLRIDQKASNPLFPSGAFGFCTVLGNASMSLFFLGVAVSSFSFLSYILQVAHGVSAIVTGYILALDALFWTLATLLAASAGPRAVRRLLVISPLGLALGLAGSAISLHLGSILGITFSIMLAGTGIGLGWSHLEAHMMTSVPPSEYETAASFISTTQLISMAFGAAFAGAILNLAGLERASTAEEVTSAGVWLLGVVTFVPVLALVTSIRVVRAPQEVVYAHH